MNIRCEQTLRKCMVCQYVEGVYTGHKDEPPPPVRRACYCAYSPDFGALVGFCAEHLSWMAEYPRYYDTITKLSYGEWL